jgi:hypothetical protein
MNLNRGILDRSYHRLNVSCIDRWWETGKFGIQTFKSLTMTGCHSNGLSMEKSVWPWDGDWTRWKAWSHFDSETFGIPQPYKWQKQSKPPQMSETKCFTNNRLFLCKHDKLSGRLVVHCIHSCSLTLCQMSSKMYHSVTWNVTYTVMSSLLLGRSEGLRIRVNHGSR